MSLSPGTRLGPYEILARIGAGGMGEVWKARDCRLNRIVAVKVTSENFSERFEREARAVAALNHPSICTLHDVGPNYLVMEYVEGQPLKGPLKLDVALKYAGQICDALDAAHKKRIIHRDLKPANILTTKSGIKLLDFGLAKVVQAREIAAGSATETITVTKENGVVGTIPYMSPEQLESKKADERSDIFAFGAVLYEMVTGKRAFEGANQASVIAAILEREPAPLSSIVQLAPPALERLVAKCLAKDPEDRWQSARDLKHQLEWIAGNEEQTVSEVTRTGTRRREGLAWILAVAALAACLFLAASKRGGNQGNRPIAFEVYPPLNRSFSWPTHVTTTVPTPQFALSPDGQALVYAASAAGDKPMLWVRPLEGVAPRVLSGTEDAQAPFWSHDSKWIGFSSGGKLKKIPAAGGPVQMIADGIANPLGASWGPDDSILIASGLNPILRVSSAGGQMSAVTVLDSSYQEGSHRYPVFLPDGYHFLFSLRSGLRERRGLFVASLDGKTKQRILPSDFSAAYASPGYLLYIEDDTLVARPFDEKNLKLHGQMFPVAQPVGRSSAGNAAISVSNNGTLAYAGPIFLQGRLTWFDRAGNPLSTVGPEANYTDLRLSPDEKQLAASMVDLKTSAPDIWLTDFTRGSSARFTFGPALNAAPVWSPDGKFLVFRSTQKGVIEMYIKAAAGGGEQRSVFSIDQLRAAHTGGINLIATDWSSDGRYLLYSVSLPSGSDVWLLPDPRLGSGGDPPGRKA